MLVEKLEKGIGPMFSQKESNTTRHCWYNLGLYLTGVKKTLLPLANTLLKHLPTLPLFPPGVTLPTPSPFRAGVRATELPTLILNYRIQVVHFAGMFICSVKILFTLPTMSVLLSCRHPGGVVKPFIHHPPELCQLRHVIPPAPPSRRGAVQVVEDTTAAMKAPNWTMSQRSLCDLVKRDSTQDWLKYLNDSDLTLPSPDQKFSRIHNMLLLLLPFEVLATLCTLPIALVNNHVSVRQE